MKKISLFSCILSSILLTGCGTTITETIYLQDVEVNGPINHPPIHITSGSEDHSITISPKIFINSTRDVYGQIKHTNVNSHGEYQLDTVRRNDGTWDYRESSLNSYKYSGKNLKWTLPEVYAGFDLDIALSKNTAFTGSLNFSSVNQTSLLGGTAGLGFFKHNGSSAFRFDFGISYQEYAYDASTVVITTVKDYNSPAETYMTFYHDISKNNDVNFYGSLIYNSVFENSPVNFFIGLSYFGQSLLDFEPSETNESYYPFGVTKYTTDARGEVSASYLSVSPGIYQNISSAGRIVVGVSIIKNMGLEQSSKSLFILPNIKFDLMF